MALNSTAIQLTWDEPHDNNAPILGYRVEYTRPEFLDGSDVILTVTSEMAVVTGLHPGVTYNFTVVAFNEIGDSRESAVTMVTTGEEGTIIIVDSKIDSSWSSDKMILYFSSKTCNETVMGLKFLKGRAVGHRSNLSCC